MSQIHYLKQDLKRILGKDKWRIIIIFFSRIFIGIFWYRIERSLFLILGNKYQILRVILSPFLYLIQAYTNIDIHYKADIGPGLLILHSSVGIVISGRSIIGKNSTLTGGNIIGMSDRPGSFIVGDNCSMGANACIIGPLKLGNNIKIGSCACVVKSYEQDGITLVGVPAKPILSSSDD